MALEYWIAKQLEAGNADAVAEGESLRIRYGDIEFSPPKFRKSLTRDHSMSYSRAVSLGEFLKIRRKKIRHDEMASKASVRVVTYMAIESDFKVKITEGMWSGLVRACGLNEKEATAFISRYAPKSITSKSSAIKLIISNAARVPKEGS